MLDHTKKEKLVPRASPMLLASANDYRRRCSFWLTDYTNGLVYWSKTLSAGLFMLFATLFSTIALGALVEKETEQRIGLSEYLLMNSVAGVAHVRRAD